MNDLIRKARQGQVLGYSLVARSGREAALAGEIRDAKNLFENLPDPVGNGEMVRAALLYGLDEPDAAHRIVQAEDGDLAAYWHGMIHRREPDFENARYWFRRAGRLPCFGELQRKVAVYSADAARQSNWDPYLFTGLCEQHRFGDDALTGELLRMQQDEFEVLFDYTWRQAFPSST